MHIYIHIHIVIGKWNLNVNVAQSCTIHPQCKVKFVRETCCRAVLFPYHFLIVRELTGALTPELPWQAARNIWPESQWHWIWVVKRIEVKKTNKTKPKIKISRAKEPSSVLLLLSQLFVLNSLSGSGASLLHCTSEVAFSRPGSVLLADIHRLRPWLLGVSKARRTASDGMLPSQPWRGNHRPRGNTQTLFHYYQWGFTASLCVAFVLPTDGKHAFSVMWESRERDERLI